MIEDRLILVPADDPVELEHTREICLDFIPSPVATNNDVFGRQDNRSRKTGEEHSYPKFAVHFGTMIQMEAEITTAGAKPRGNFAPVKFCAARLAAWLNPAGFAGHSSLPEFRDILRAHEVPVEIHCFR